MIFQGAAILFIALYVYFLVYILCTEEEVMFRCIAPVSAFIYSFLTIGIIVIISFAVYLAFGFDPSHVLTYMR